MQIIKSISTSLLISLFLVVPSALDAVEPSVTKSDLFVAGENAYKLYRIPGIVVTKRGTVPAYCEARKNDSGDWGPIDVLMRRSTDGGRTWLPTQQLVHLDGNLPMNPVAAAQNLDRPGENTVNNPVAIVDHQSGAVHFLYCLAHNLSRRDGQETPGRSRDRLNVTIKLSYDEGQTWPVQRTLEAGFSGYSDLAALTDGTILCFYERGSTDGESNYRTGRLTVARFDERWVRAGNEADVCVYGGTSGGVIAAVQAARMGKRVVLVEPGRHLGGMTSSGLSAVDIGDPRSVGGLARVMFAKAAAWSAIW